MARAEAASASVRSDSIKGLAQSIAKPAYRRLLTAEPALRRALQTFEDLGARPMAAAVARRLRELGVTGIPRGPQSVTRANPAGLTRRELEVLRLVATGLSNIQVSKRLVISPRTVDTHLTSIYSKIGVSSRSAATRYAIEHHLV